MPLNEAKDPQTLPERLSELFLASPCADEIVAAIARNPNTPTPTLLRAWALDPKGFEENPIVELLLLESPHFWRSLPVETLKALLTLPSITPDLLTQFSTHWSFDIRPLVAKHPRTPPEALHALASTYPLKTQENVATHPNTRADTLFALLSSAEKSIRDLAAKHPNTPAEMLSLLRRAGMVFFDEVNTLDASLSPEEMEPLFSCGARVIELLQAHPNIREAQLITLFKKYQRRLSGVFAANPRMPVACLEELAAHRSPHVAALLAKNPRANEKILSECLTIKSAAVAVEVARREDLSLSLQEMIARDKRDEVRLALAQNLKASPEILQRLAASDYSNLRATVGARPDATPEVLAQLARDKRELVKLAVASNPSTPPHILSILAQDEGEPVRRAAQQHPSTPKESLRELEEIRAAAEVSAERLLRLAQGGSYAKQVALEHPCAPIELVYRLARSAHKTERCLVAHSHKAPQALLERLAQDPEIEVRAAVAANVAASPQALAILANEPRAELVLHALASNPAAPPSLLAGLIDAKVKGLRERLARNPAASPALLKRIFASYQERSEPAVLLALFANPNLPSSLLLQLETASPQLVLQHPKIQGLPAQGAEGFQDISARTLAGLLRLPEIEERFLLWAAEHPDEQVRAEVAGHQKTPRRVLLSMCQDESLAVLRRLSKNAAAPQALLVALAQLPDRSLRRNLLNNKTSPAFLLRWFTDVDNDLGHLAKKLLLERARRKK